MDFFKILAPIEWVVAWIMYLAHSALTWIGLDPASGAAWGLSVVALVTIMRIILIPLFFKQIHAQRGMQRLTPEMQVIHRPPGHPTAAGRARCGGVRTDLEGKVPTRAAESRAWPRRWTTPSRYRTSRLRRTSTQ